MRREKGELVHDNFRFSHTEDSQETSARNMCEHSASNSTTFLSTTDQVRNRTESLRCKNTGSHFHFRKGTSMIWTVSMLLAFGLSVFAVMPASTNPLSTNCTVTENCKDYLLTEPQLLVSNLTGSTEYTKWFGKPSMASMKSIFKLDRIKESSRRTLSNISDFGLHRFRSVFQYFRSVRRCLKIEKATSRAPPNRAGHESVGHSMNICPREDRMNPCSIIETRGIEHERDHGYFYTEDETIQQHNGSNHIEEQANSVYQEIHSYPKLDQISVEDQQKKISEIYFSSPQQIEIVKINLEDLHINDTSEGPIFELHPHEFWWLIWAILLVLATLVLMILIHKGRNPPNKLQSQPYYSSQTSTNMHGGDYRRVPIGNNKTTAHGRKTTTESTESPMLGSFIDYVDIAVRKEGSRNKELKITPVRRSARIRNKNCPPLRSAPNF